METHATTAALPDDLEAVARELAGDPAALARFAQRLRGELDGGIPFAAVCAGEGDDVDALVIAALHAKGYDSREQFAEAGGFIAVTVALPPDPQDIPADAATAPVSTPAPAPDGDLPAGYRLNEMIVSIQSMAKRKGWRVVTVTNRAAGGADVTVRARLPSDQIMFSGDVSSVFAQMHDSSNVVALPVPPSDADRLSERLKPHGWSVRDHGSDGRCTLLRGRDPIFSGTMADATAFAEQKILNIPGPRWGLTLSNEWQSE